MGIPVDTLQQHHGVLRIAFAEHGSQQKDMDGAVSL